MSHNIPIKVQQFLSVLQQKVPYQIGVSYNEDKHSGVVHRVDYFIQIGLQRFTLWCNVLDNPVSYGWDTNSYNNPSWEFEFE